MSDAWDRSSTDAAENIDPGLPIAELAGFEHDVSIGLLDRVRHAIGRRTFAAQITTFALATPTMILKEFWLVVIGLFDPQETRKDNTR